MLKFRSHNNRVCVCTRYIANSKHATYYYTTETETDKRAIRSDTTLSDFVQPNALSGVCITTLYTLDHVYYDSDQSLDQT